MKEFFKKNLTGVHIIGIVIGVAFALIYWWKVGQFHEMIIKNNPYIISIMGAAIGYITMDLVKNANQSKSEE